VAKEIFELLALKQHSKMSPKVGSAEIAREASWRRGFNPYAPLLFNLYHYLEQNLHFGLVPENQF